MASLGRSTGIWTGIMGHGSVVRTANVAVVNGVAAFGEVVVCASVSATELLIGVSEHADC
jgi:hypothetical protein